MRNEWITTWSLFQPNDQSNHKFQVWNRSSISEFLVSDFFFSAMKFWISWKKFWIEPIIRNSRRRKNSVKIQEFYFRIPDLCIVLLFVQLDSVLFSLKQTETTLSHLELSFGRISNQGRSWSYDRYFTIFKSRSLARSERS